MRFIIQIHQKLCCYICFLSADDPGIPDGSERVRSRKQPIAPKFLSVPNVTRNNSAQGDQFTNAGDSGHSRVRSWTLPTKSSEGNEEKTVSTAPGIWDSINFGDNTLLCGLRIWGTW